ncbi:hypothetical protein [Flectobacillus longus]|uniref:hypothetical protein n=1 Tax=Flectobacillus longus TaxID=2984207 RepID=UPI0024B78421|nr:hypothetical protein [Flectobacillus longus]MDI9878061.1 hypothetical protein [Flectobacillus longus]
MAKRVLSTVHYNPLANNHFAEVRRIITAIEKGWGVSLIEFKKGKTRKQLYELALMCVDTTNKALCTALEIPVESACRLKRELEEEGKLVTSDYQVKCPITGSYARLISTSNQKFSLLRASSL